MQLLCRNRVADFDAWWEVFRTDAGAQKAAGFHLRDIWQNADDPNEVFFIFDVEDRTKAQSFMDAPAAEEAARDSGVIDWDYYFIRRSKDR